MCFAVLTLTHVLHFKKVFTTRSVAFPSSKEEKRFLNSLNVELNWTLLSDIAGLNDRSRCIFFDIDVETAELVAIVFQVIHKENNRTI